MTTLQIREMHTNTKYWVLLLYLYTTMVKKCY